jgi:hypothetical protein
VAWLAHRDHVVEVVSCRRTNTARTLDDVVNFLGWFPAASAATFVTLHDNRANVRRVGASVPHDRQRTNAG